MGCTVREKHIRTNRRARSVKLDADHSKNMANNTNASNNNGLIYKSKMESGFKQFNYQMCKNNNNDLSQNSNPNSVFDDSGWGYCNEEQLEGILLRNLEFLYNEAVSKLMSLGYDKELALKAILRNGHCYGEMDILTNILHNALAFLNRGNNENSEESEPGFTDLRQLEEYSLAGMVCLLQQTKPQLSRGDAMWCLLMSDLHVGRASDMEIPVLPSSTGNSSCSGFSVSNGTPEMVSNGSIGVSPALFRFHGGWGYGNGGTSEFPMNGFFPYAPDMSLQKEIDCPKRFDLTPAMRALLKRNVAMFAAGFRANARQFQSQLQTSSGSLPAGGDSSIGGGKKIESLPARQSEETQPLSAKNQDVVNSVLSKFRKLNLDENTEQTTSDQKDEMMLSLVHQLKDLEKQLKERKMWAHQKAIQAARKISHDSTELKMLRIEREESQRLKKGKQALEDTTVVRVAEMENALRKASGQVDRANAAVRKLENENAEIKAEIEASKLSASESEATRLEVAKRAKKHLKKLLAWEKQKAKLQEDIATEKQKILDIKQQLSHVEAAQKEAEEKWKQERKAKEQATAQVEHERRLKEAAEANSKRRLETLRLKYEIDFQRQEDDQQRLEQELVQLKASALCNELQNESKNGMLDEISTQGETIAKLLEEFCTVEKSSSTKKKKGGGGGGSSSSHDRDCIMCRKDEVCVVFLPCAHEVLCVNCNETYTRKGKTMCPICRVPIDRRIRVFGPTS